MQQQRESYEYKKWDQLFKDRALCRCILEGFGGNLKVSMILDDKSFYDPLAIGVFDSAIDKILIGEVKKMSKDSISSIGKYPSDLKGLLEGKRVMSHCLNFYKSNRLDSLMKIEKVKWKNIEDITEEITKTIPTY